MKCPRCVGEGKRSQVYAGGGFSTLVACQPFYDEDGIYHSHDLNTQTWNYSCSNGHRWTVSGTSKCPNCNFGGERTTKFWDEPVESPLKDS